MKLLLTTLNSKFIHSNLAIKYLYAQAMQEVPELCRNVTMTEFTINNEYSYVYGEILRGKYDVVCFSCYIWNIEQIKGLCEDLKKAQPNLLIVLGGPEVSYDAKAFLAKHQWVDIIIKGEGERTFTELLKAFQEVAAGTVCTENCELAKSAADGSQRDILASLLDEKLSGIGSLVYRNKSGCMISETLNYPLPAMENIAFPYEYIDVEKDKVIYYEASRGCPYRCSYCLSSIDKSVRVLPAEETKKQLDFFLARNVKQVKFIDRTFNCDKDRAYDIWEYLIRNDNGTTNFHFEICAEIIEEKHLELLKNAREGLFQFEIGIQSANSQVLSEIDRSPKTEKLFENVRRLIAMKNSHIHVDLIAGLPYEDFDSFRESFNSVYALEADNLQLGFLKVLCGTKMHEKREKYNIVYRNKAPYEIISNKFISPLEVARLKMVENVLDLYHNKGGFAESTTFLISKEKSAFDFYDNLAEFFYREGFQHRSHKKEDLYRILLKYVSEKTNLGMCSDDFYDWAKELIEKDLRETMNFDAVKKFMRKGWDI